MKYVLVDSHSVPGADYDVEKKLLEWAGFEVVIAAGDFLHEIFVVHRFFDDDGPHVAQAVEHLQDGLVAGVEFNDQRVHLRTFYGTKITFKNV